MTINSTKLNRDLHMVRKTCKKQHVSQSCNHSLDTKVVLNDKTTLHNHKRLKQTSKILYKNLMSILE